MKLTIQQQQPTVFYGLSEMWKPHVKRPNNRIFNFFVGDTLTLKMMGGEVVWAIVETHGADGEVVVLANAVGGGTHEMRKRDILTLIKGGHITVGRQAAALRD